MARRERLPSAYPLRCSGRARLGEIASPATQLGYLRCLERGMSLAHEPLHFSAVFEFHRADRERRRNRSDEAAEMRGRNLPHLDLDRLAVPIAHHTRPRWRAPGQRV